MVNSVKVTMLVNLAHNRSQLQETSLQRVNSWSLRGPLPASMVHKKNTAQCWPGNSLAHHKACIRCNLARNISNSFALGSSSWILVDRFPSVLKSVEKGPQLCYAVQKTKQKGPQLYYAAQNQAKGASAISPPTDELTIA